MNNFRLADGMALTEIEIDLHRLDAIDNRWTSFLDRATPDDVESQKQDLDKLTTELLAALVSARGSVERLRTMLEDTDEVEFEAALEMMAAQYPEVDQAYRSDLADLLGEYSVRGMAIEACLYLEEQLPREIDAVEAKRSRLMAGEFQPGDLSPGAKCALRAAMLGVKVLDMATTGGVGSLVLDGAIGFGSFALKWKSGCGEVAGRVWRRLRDG